MELTIREFILVRIAEDMQQTAATANAAWDHAGLMKTAYDHRAALGTLSNLLEVHVPAGDRCQDCGRAWPCNTIRAIARTWRDFPEYAQAWEGP